jgi:hypothetical protein
LHDFDIDRQYRHEGDRQFKLGGEVFTHRGGIRPEVQQQWEEMPAETPGSEALKITDALIVAWLDTDADPTGPERFRKLRERESDPITGRDINNLIVWLYTQSTRRPTEPLSSSEDGRGETTPTSTATSSTEPVEASAA